MTQHKHSRRDVLKLGAAALATPYLVPQSAFGANEKVNLAIIGTGGRASQIVGQSNELADRNIVAICDCFKPDMETFAAKVGKGQNWNQYEDFRKMIETENLDGVFIETTTHARAWIAIQAMQMGMDAYIEKPMCLTISEGREMVKAARKYNRVTQVGTQQRSLPYNNWACDLIQDGAIGKVKTVLAPNFVGPVMWDDSTPGEKLPEGGSKGWWNTWTNQAPMRSYHHDIHHRWEKWNAYDGGGLCFSVTGWGTHSYDQLQRGLGTCKTGPVQIMLEEPVSDQACGKFETVSEVDETSLDYLLRLAKPVEGPRAKVRMWYANGTEVRLHLDGDWGPGLGAIFVGEDGKIEVNRDKIASNRKDLMALESNPGPTTEREGGGRPETEYHIANFIDCIKSREECNADIEIGLRSTSVCYLVNIVREIGQVGKKLDWDPETEQFTNCPEGNTSSYVTRERRKGFELPDLG